MVEHIEINALVLYIYFLYTLIAITFSIKCLINHIFSESYIPWEFSWLKINAKYGHQWRHQAKKWGWVRNVLKNMHFFILFPTFGDVKKMVLTWNFKFKLICIILMFGVIYIPIDNFKGAKTWEKLPSKKSRLNIFFLPFLIKACRILINMPWIIHEDDPVPLPELNKKLFWENKQNFVRNGLKRKVCSKRRYVFWYPIIRLKIVLKTRTSATNVI